MATDPNWKANIMAGIAEQRKRNRRTGTVFGTELRPLQLTATIKFVRYADEAARTLNVNRSTFMRRAIAVAASKITGTDVFTILYESPAASGYGDQRMRVKTGGARDTGEGIGAWCPHPGCDGSHFESDSR
jgi:hypothetical protein